MGVKFNDNSSAVLAAMNTSEKKALTAIGLTAVEITNDYMKHKYYRPIYRTGDLIRSITSQVRLANGFVDFGSNLDYGLVVHEGSSKMAARPFLRDAAMDNKEIWREIASEYIGEGMK